MEGVFEMGQLEGFLLVKAVEKNRRDRRDAHHRGWFT